MFRIEPLISAYVSSSLKYATRIAKYVFEKSFIDSASVELVNSTSMSSFQHLQPTN